MASGLAALWEAPELPGRSSEVAEVLRVRAEFCKRFEVEADDGLKDAAHRAHRRAHRLVRDMPSRIGSVHALLMAPSKIRSATTTVFADYTTVQKRKRWSAFSWIKSTLGDFFSIAGTPGADLTISAYKRATHVEAYPEIVAGSCVADLLQSGWKVGRAACRAVAATAQHAEPPVAIFKTLAPERMEYHVKTEQPWRKIVHEAPSCVPIRGSESHGREGHTRASRATCYGHPGLL